MTYLRVVPRDLFNEADLLKCLGKLAILLDYPGHKAVLSEGSGAPFLIEQDPSSGALSVTNLPFTIAGKPWRLTRPLNSRQPWPLYAETDDECIAVFDSGGTLTDEFEALIYGEEPAVEEDPPAKIERLDKAHPNWRSLAYENGQRQFADDGTMLDHRGNRSIFDDVDE